MQYMFGIINPSGTMNALNEGWHIDKIVEPVVLTGVIFLTLTSSDLAIDPEFSW